MCWCFCIGESQSSQRIWVLQLEIVRTDNSEALSSLFSARVICLILSCVTCTLLSLFFWSVILCPRQTKLMFLLSGTSKATLVLCLYLPLAYYRLGEVGSALPLAPGVLAHGKQPVRGRSPGLLAPSRAATFDLSCVQYKRRMHKSAFHAPLSKKHSGETFGRQNVPVIDMCPTCENIPWHHTPFIFLLCAVSTDLLSASSHSSGNRDCLACVASATLCGSVDILCQAARDVFSSQNPFFKQNKNAWAWSLLHMYIVLILVSIGPEIESEE